MPLRATLHLISGLPCAGKTHHAKRLKRQHKAVLLSLDRWLITAHGRYPIDTVGQDEHVRRVYAARELIWSVTAELLSRGIDVVLDDGFFLRSDREAVIQKAAALGARATIHHVDTPLPALRQRLAARNRAPDEHHFEISGEALDLYAAIFEAPSAEEGAELVVVRRQ